MNAWQLRRSGQGMGTSSPSQLLLERDTWTNLRKQALGYSEAGAAHPILLPWDWLILHSLRFSFDLCPLQADIFSPANSCAWRMGSATLVIAHVPQLPATLDSSISNSL